MRVGHCDRTSPWYNARRNKWLGNGAYCAGGTRVKLVRITYVVTAGAVAIKKTISALITNEAIS